MSIELPATFPGLHGPGPPNNDVDQAYRPISDSYNSSLQLLHQDDLDPLRIHFHLDRLQNRIIPLYHALPVETLPQDWVRSGAHALGKLLVTLRATIADAEDWETLQRSKPTLITTTRTPVG
ncbi:hypothetical protein JB92DRAFT_3109869 [Gautieria morchelliformis]|nr:hypothetical protein JB92DRAFT_3109869 [Gautieria morchelliformis]